MNAAPNRVRLIFAGRDCRCCDQWIARIFGDEVRKEPARWFSGERLRARRKRANHRKR